MYIKAFLILLVSASVIAHPSSGPHDHDHDDHDHHDHLHEQIMSNCSTESGFPRENIEKIIFDKTGHFCSEPGGSEWMTCYFKNLNLMNDEHEFDAEHLRRDFVDNENSLELFDQCLTETKVEEDKKKACSLYHCVLEKGIVDFEHDEDHHDH